MLPLAIAIIIGTPVVIAAFALLEWAVWFAAAIAITAIGRRT